MSTDRELLELAAKAAGVRYEPEASKPHPISGAFFGLWLVFDGEPWEYAKRFWNPLTDDGDALRLAVKLGLWVKVHVVFGAHVSSHECRDECGLRITMVEHNEGDPCAATRLAIVRAAAEIGRQS